MDEMDELALHPEGNRYVMRIAARAARRAARRIGPIYPNAAQIKNAADRWRKTLAFDKEVKAIMDARMRLPPWTN